MPAMAQVVLGLLVGVGLLWAVMAWASYRTRLAGEAAVLAAIHANIAEREAVFEYAWWSLGGPHHKDTMLAARSVSSGLKGLISRGEILAHRRRDVDGNEHEYYTLAERVTEHAGWQRLIFMRFITRPVDGYQAISRLVGVFAWSFLALIIVGWFQGGFS